MYPIAWAVVRVDNSDNWCWFLALLHDDLKLQQGTRLNLTSDGHKGLHEAVRDWLPNSEHRKHQTYICQLHKEVQWVVAMHNIAVNLEDQITPTVRKKLEHWTVFPSAYQLLEVRCGDLAFGVNLGEKTCACRLWQLSGIPMVPLLGTQMWKRTGNHPPLPPIVGRMSRRPWKEKIKAPSENNSQNKAVCIWNSCISKRPWKAPIQRKPPGRTRQSVFGTHASARGRDRGSRGGRDDRGGRNSSGRGVRGGRNGSANRGLQLMDEDEIRENLERDYMQDLLDAEEDKSNWTEDESMDVDAYSSKNSSTNFNAFTQKSIINDPSHPTQSTEVQVGDGQVAASAASDDDVATSAQEKNKGKAIQEGSNSKSGAKPVRKSKRLRQ
ncbi:hypothetical protein Tco_1440222 [Tanacetum coccineum]